MYVCVVNSSIESNNKTRYTYIYTKLVCLPKKKKKKPHFIHTSRYTTTIQCIEKKKKNETCFAENIMSKQKL